MGRTVTFICDQTFYHICCTISCYSVHLIKETCPYVPNTMQIQLYSYMYVNSKGTLIYLKVVCYSSLLRNIELCLLENLLKFFWFVLHLSRVTYIQMIPCLYMFYSFISMRKNSEMHCSNCDFFCNTLALHEELPLSYVTQIPFLLTLPLNVKHLPFYYTTNHTECPSGVGWVSIECRSVGLVVPVYFYRLH